MPADITPCQLLSSLQFTQAKLLHELNAQLRSLQRIAQLLEQGGLASIALPNISALVPVSSLTPAVYNQLRVACPMLNLPAVGVGLAGVQATLSKAYKSLLNHVHAHPWFRLGNLQAIIDKKLNLAKEALIIKWANCAAAICNGVDNGLAITQSQFEANLNALNGPFQVLNDNQKTRLQSVQTLKTQLQALT